MSVLPTSAIARSLLNPTYSRLSTVVRLFTPSRYAGGRVKQKWASKYKPVGASQIALEFMDAHYPRLYGVKGWTVMRCAMLSRRKYAMLFNSYFPDQNKCHAVALENGAFEIMCHVRARLDRIKTGEYQRVEKEGVLLLCRVDHAIMEGLGLGEEGYKK